MSVHGDGITRGGCTAATGSDDVTAPLCGCAIEGIGFAAIGRAVGLGGGGVKAGAGTGVCVATGVRTAGAMLGEGAVGAGHNHEPSTAAVSTTAPKMGNRT
jgi:hypothetical protein